MAYMTKERVFVLVCTLGWMMIGAANEEHPSEVRLDSKSRVVFEEVLFLEMRCYRMYEAGDIEKLYSTKDEMRELRPIVENNEFGNFKDMLKERYKMVKNFIADLED